MLCRQDLKSYNIIWGTFGVSTSLTVALRLCLCKQIEGRHEAIIQQSLGKGDSFNLVCLHQYPSRGDRSTPHLTMETEPGEGSRANTDWDSETCKIHAHCRLFDDRGLYAGWEHCVLMSCSLICLTRLSWQLLPMVLITQSERKFSSTAANVCAGCMEVWSTTEIHFFPSVLLHKNREWFCELTEPERWSWKEGTDVWSKVFHRVALLLSPIYSNVFHVSWNSQAILASLHHSSLRLLPFPGASLDYGCPVCWGSSLIIPLLSSTFGLVNFNVLSCFS